MFKLWMFLVVLFVATGVVSVQAFAVCTTIVDGSSFNGKTAALINPAGPVTGAVDATGCDIGVYFSGGTVEVTGAEVYGAQSYGIAVNGDSGDVFIDIIDSHVHNIGDVPFNGNQRGVGIYLRSFGTLTTTGSISGTITGNLVDYYQKGGIVVNGKGAFALVHSNTVSGLGPVIFIAQNGIQIGYGATADVKFNEVSGNQYSKSGGNTASGGILVLGGPGFGVCPDGVTCPYSSGSRIMKNVVANNDVGIWMQNIDASYNSPPNSQQTNIKVVNNEVSNATLVNGYAGVGYQAGIADQGNNDKIIGNDISGDGYDSSVFPAAYVSEIDADVSFTNRPKVHANQ